ncbi:osteocalcin 2-like isoform X1 [Larimichthys crocea]|uniref:osteocalcin 2-like isoform X1 n=1 Tax=Larimichthys crocea TaxID=215358 RepID=UPI000F5E0D33|nr:osteocalcin 2-like isoform X1 [Larimichthys crocea]
MERINQRYSWTAVIKLDPNFPDSPRLILRRVPAAAPQTPPGFPPSSRLSFSSNSSTSSSSSYSCESSSSSFCESSSSSFCESSSSSSSEASSSSSSSTSSSSSSPGSLSRSTTKDELWTCVLLEGENKIILRKLPVASSSDRPEEPSKQYK